MVKVAFVVGEYPAEERKRRENTALSYATRDIEVGIISVTAKPYLHTMTPAETNLVAGPFMEAFREAEKQGYDAIVPLGTLDLGVDGGRSVVDIPIIAPAEAMFHIACMLGDRFGVLIYHKDLMPITRRMISRYQMESKVVGWRDTGFALTNIAANSAAAKANMIAQCRSLVEEQEVEVILPMGITQCPVWIKPEELSAAVGVPVVEGIGAPIRLAGMFASLGLKHSRRRWPKSHSFP